MMNALAVDSPAARPTASILGFETEIRFVELGGMSYPDSAPHRNHRSFINTGIDAYVVGLNGTLRVFNSRTGQHYYLVPVNPEEGDEVVLFGRTIAVREPGKGEVGGFGGFVRVGRDGDPFRDIVTKKSADGSIHPEDARVRFAYLPGSWTVGNCYRIARVCF